MALAITSYATAATVSLIVDPEDAALGYGESDFLTIWLVGEGFTAPPDGFCSLTINGGIMTDHGGMASAPAVNTTYLPQMPQNGTLVNSGGTLIAGPITGTAAMGDLTGVPNGEPAYSFEYHMPGVPPSTIITIYVSDISISGSFGAPVSVDFVPLQIHMAIPEPMTIALLSLGGLFLRRRR